ncbi:M50 family metallopeptidase [Shewanella gaetbuli]|uniref:M50 family metallopeptidase n=1 Tax=Shewanella gaetbuli TaxID=220752 RepID=A0A9X2CLX2_9GAMM|nr:M50 family metallopeptidase [Shewanella gaetbuli]MCL1143060.1 M50 family metallopeptidase [Shewanella gaetbuli]
MSNNNALKQTDSGIPSRSRFIVELILAFLLTRIPYISIPIKWFESFFHELSHGIATIVTGGIVSHIELFPNGTGLCFSQGGSGIIIAFSGYMGAAVWGYIIFLLATWREGIRFTLTLLALTLVASIVFWVRDFLTLLIVIALVGLILLPLKVKNSRPLNSLLRILALVIIVNAMASPVVLFGLPGQGDAAALAQMTWIPAWIWVFLWLGISCGALWLCWKKVIIKKEKFNEI